MEKPDGRQVDLENQQVRATRMQKMEPENSTWLPRASKKEPMSQKWRRLGNKRHLRKHKWRSQMETQKPIGDEKEAIMANRAPKKFQKRSKSETLEKLKIELPLQRELSSAHERPP